MSEELNTLVDVTIKDVKRGPSGESKHGPWQIHKIYLEGYKGDFAYFEKDGETIPKRGMKIRVFDYETKQNQKDGKTYTNHTIKRLTYADGEKHEPRTDTQVPKRAPHGIPEPQSIDIPISQSVMTSYHKDFICAMIRGASLIPDNIPIAMDGFIQCADEFLDASIRAGLRVTSAPKAKPNTEPIEVPKLQPSGDYEEEPTGLMDGPDKVTDPDDIPF